MRSSLIAPAVNIRSLGSQDWLQRHRSGHAGVGAVFVLVIYDAPRWSRLNIFFRTWIAGLALKQAREKTNCLGGVRGVQHGRGRNEHR